MNMTTVGRRIAWQSAGTQTVANDFAPAAFYEAWFPRVYAYFARRTVDAAMAEDLTADTFERMVAALPGFQPNDNPAATRVWVYRIAANVYKNSLREAGRRHARDSAWAAGWQPVDQADPEQSIVLGQAVATLDPADRDVLGLRFWEDLTAGEIAGVLGVNQREVYTTLDRCMRALRRQLALTAARGRGAAEEAGDG
jgi:RNA polymerase sigma factor (sigma-70 family)